MIFVTANAVSTTNFVLSCLEGTRLLMFRAMLAAKSGLLTCGKRVLSGTQLKRSISWRLIVNRLLGDATQIHYGSSSDFCVIVESRRAHRALSAACRYHSARPRTSQPIFSNQDRELKRAAQSPAASLSSVHPSSRD